jgi:YVTN family beta-propeller protein
VNHSAAVAPDGSGFYITNQADVALDVANTKNLKVVKKIPLTNHPNTVAVSKDGKASTWRLSPAPAPSANAGRSARCRSGPSPPCCRKFRL